MDHPHVCAPDPRLGFIASHQHTVTDNRDLGEGWHRIEIDAPDLAPRVRAGQFVQVAVGGDYDPLVRRPFSVYDVLPAPGPSAERLRLLYQVVGPGTRYMEQLRPRDRIDLLGPLGQPLPRFPLSKSARLFLVGGGIGVAPLYLYCRELSTATPPYRVEVVLGARRQALLVGREAFVDLGLVTHVATDDGSAGYRGNAIALLRSLIDTEPSTLVAGIGCGPHGMNVALRDYVVAHQLDFWISLENYMPCGFGACFGCVIEAPAGRLPKYRRVCLEGPAFPAAELPARF